MRRARRVRDVLGERLDEARPQTLGQLHNGNVGHALRRRRRPKDLGAERPKDPLLDVLAHVLGQGPPSLLLLRPEGLVAGRQLVLELQAGGRAHHRWVLLLVEHI